MAKKSTGKSGKKAPLFVRGWYLCYHKHGKRKHPRVGPDREVARQTAAEINTQWKVGLP